MPELDEKLKNLVKPLALMDENTIDGQFESNG